MDAGKRSSAPLRLDWLRQEGREKASAFPWPRRREVAGVKAVELTAATMKLEPATVKHILEKMALKQTVGGLKTGAFCLCPVAVFKRATR